MLSADLCWPINHKLPLVFDQCANQTGTTRVWVWYIQELMVHLRVDILEQLAVLYWKLKIFNLFKHYTSRLIQNHRLRDNVIIMEVRFIETEVRTKQRHITFIHGLADNIKCHTTNARHQYNGTYSCLHQTNSNFSFNYQQLANN